MKSTAQRKRKRIKLWSRRGIEFTRAHCAELERACEARMEHSEKTDARFARFALNFAGNGLVATLGQILRLIIDGCSGNKIHYTKDEAGEKVWLSFGAKAIRSIWCTMCAATEKCANSTSRVLATKAALPIRSFA